jgi:TRAP-type mannitol/chloroaromatic compound transport system permease large subunit
MGMIFRSSIPFLLLQALGLWICIAFPDIILWLPRAVYG